MVVTCTNGELGDGAGRSQARARTGMTSRRWPGIAWLSCANPAPSWALADLELLGYQDSGMVEWDYKDRPDAFCNIPQAKVAARISGLIERYRPQVLITYDDQGPYQHPDHVHASRSRAGGVRGHRHPGQAVPQRHARQQLAEGLGGAARARRGGARTSRSGPGSAAAAARSPRQRITTMVDIRPVLRRKNEALFAHASQISESWFSKIPPEIAEASSATRASSGPATPPGRRCPRTTCSPGCARGAS